MPDLNDNISSSLPNYAQQPPLPASDDQKQHGHGVSKVPSKQASATQGSAGTSGVDGSGSLSPSMQAGMILGTTLGLLISSMGALNNYLATYSRTVLASDVTKANQLARSLANIKFNPGTSPSAQAQNRSLALHQQVIMAQMKNQSNTQGLHISDAQTVTSDMQQQSASFSSILSSINNALQSIPQQLS